MFRSFSRSSAQALLLYACLGLAALQFAGCSSKAQRAQNYYKSGTSYLAKNDFAKARIEFKNAVQLKPDMIEAWRGLVKIDEHDRNWNALAGDLSKVVELAPKHNAARIQLSKLFLLGGAFDRALKLANDAGKLEPKNPEALALKAAILFKLQDTKGAIQTAQKALEIDPGNAAANASLAVAKFSEGDASGALQALENVAPAHKDDVGILTLKINIFEHMGKTQQAETLLRRLTELHPKEPFFRTQLIRFYIAHKRPDDALHELRAVVEANPADTAAELELVVLLNGLKGPAAARAELVSRIKAGGKVFPYQIALAKLDFSHGDVSNSTKLLEQLINDKKSSPNDVLTARITLAEMYLSKNNVAAAEPLISDILREDSHNVDALRLRASIRINRAQYDDAIADLRTALNYQPQSPALLAALGIAYERSGSIELADKALHDAMKASKFAPTYGLNYVAFLRRRNLATQAESVLDDLASRNPSNIAILSALAQDKLARHDWIGAHAVAEAIRRLGGKSAALADQISGVAFSGQNEFSKSLEALQNAYSANPVATQPMATLVGVYLQSKQIDKAEAFIKTVLDANPHNAEAIVLKGTIQIAKNNLRQAEADFKYAIKQQPNNITGYRALASLYIRQKKLDAALSTIHAGLQKQPRDFGFRLTLGGLLEAKGEYEPAIAEYEAMLKDQPGSMVVANNLASLLTDHRTDKASLERAKSLVLLLKNSQVPQFKDTMGWVDYKLGDYTAASSLLEAAATELPNVPLVHYHLGMTYLATGQAAKAAEQFKKARNLAPNDTELKEKIDAALSRKQKG